MADSVLDAAKLTLREYVDGRVSRLSDTAKHEMGIDGEIGRSFVSYMFSVEYVHARHLILEKNCLQLYRRYLAALQTLEDIVGPEKAVEMLSESLSRIPDDIGEVPDIA